jgi:hypothetical protein
MMVELKKLFHFQLQRISRLFEGIQRRIALTYFDPAQVLGVYADPVGQSI